VRKPILRKPKLRNVLAVATAAGIALTGSLGVARPAAQAASPVTIIFWNGPDTTGTVPTLISNFNKGASKDKRPNSSPNPHLKRAGN